VLTGRFVDMEKIRPRVHYAHRIAEEDPHKFESEHREMKEKSTKVDQ
jgi:hypothetical protein